MNVTSALHSVDFKWYNIVAQKEYQSNAPWRTELGVRAKRVSGISAESVQNVSETVKQENKPTNNRKDRNLRQIPMPNARVENITTYHYRILKANTYRGLVSVDPGAFRLVSDRFLSILKS